MKNLKDAIILGIITLMAGLILGGVYQLTKEPIEKNELLAKEEAYQKVCSKATSFEEMEDGLIIGMDEAGTEVGIVVKATSKEGYNGDISLVVGFSIDGVIEGIDFLEISETPGLGMKAKEDSFKNQYMGKNVDETIVVDGISGATYTSNAVTEAVNMAQETALAYLLEE